MSAELDRVLEPAGLAARDFRLERSEPVVGWPRLAELATPGGDVELRVTVRGAPGGGALLEAELATRVDATCQRCLEPMSIELVATPRLAFDVAGAEPAGYEPGELEEGTTLRQLLEDEMLLALPAVPVHARREDCGPLADELVDLAPDEERAPRQRPFGVLAGLGRKDG